MKAGAKTVDRLLKLALSYPEAWEDHPWDETVVKVRKKIFVFVEADAEGLRLSLKLPDSASFALSQPFVTPTGYGLGKSGWVSARFAKGERAPLDLLTDWIDESYRAIAAKTLVKLLPQ